MLFIDFGLNSSIWWSDLENSKRKESTKKDVAKFTWSGKLILVVTITEEINKKGRAELTLPLPSSDCILIYSFHHLLSPAILNTDRPSKTIREGSGTGVIA